MANFPNPGAFRAVAEEDLETVDETTPEDDELKRLLLTASRLYKCDTCAGLIVFWKGAEEPEFYPKG